MKTTSFLASAAKAAFALAAVVMMSAVFTSCSKDNDDDNPPAPKTQIVVLDGVEKSIVKAEYEDKGSGNYKLFFYLVEEGSAERVEFQLNKGLHMSGSPVNLAEKEKEHDGKWYWVIEYYDADDERIIDIFGNPGTSNPVFTTGTLTMSGDPKGTINIKLENGRVKGTNGKEHTLILSYSGKMTAKK